MDLFSNINLDEAVVKIPWVLRLLKTLDNQSQGCKEKLDEEKVLEEIKENSKGGAYPYPLVENNSIPDATELPDIILCFDDRKKSQYFFEEISLDKAFKVIEIGLGLIYDMLYPKATIIHSFLRPGFRLLSFCFTGITLALFSVIDMHNFSSIDLVLTFLLLSVAILLELCAFLLLLSSDWTDIWLGRRATTSVPRAIIHKAITCLQLPKQPRWSNYVTIQSIKLFPPR
ncbi:hypothetical protein CFP56_024814 [Quercus suber]|uniref:DUF4220 domain-containing protein n=1 Tax=Quercus suber TaxID=58331 RepID=A0AAW0K6R4_QUESU